MKYLLHTMLLSLLAPLAGAGELVTPLDEEYTGSISYSANNKITHIGHKIIFAEPVVQSVGGYSYLMNDTGESDLFEISGEGPLPVGKWESESELRIYFPKNVQPGARYKLSFKPGHRKYLSGTPMRCADFEFETPPCLLRKVWSADKILMAGRENGEVLLEPVSRVYQGDAPPSVGTKFEFYLYRTGETVPGVAMPVRVKDLRPKELQKRYQTFSQEELEALTPETIVPGLLLVQPERPIAEYWELHAEDATGKSVWKNSEPVYGRFDTQLRAELQPALAQHRGEPVICLGVLFNAPIAQEAVPQLFKDIELRCGDTVAEHVEGTHSKKLVLNGKEVYFTLHEEPLYGDNDDFDRIIFPNLGVDRLVIRVEGEVELPQQVTATVPAGTRALYGLSMPQAVTCSADLQVLAPALPVRDTPITVPLHGKHSLDLPCVGCKQVRAKLAYLPQPELKDMLLSDKKERAEIAAAWLQVLKNDFGPEQVYTMQPNGLKLTPLHVDLEALAAEPLKVGTYVLYLKAEHDAPAVSSREFEYLPYADEVVLYLTVTNLGVLATYDKALAYRLSDATPLPAARVSVQCCDSYTLAPDYEWRELLNGSIHQGVLKFHRDISSERHSRICVTCGEDKAEALLSYSWELFGEQEPASPLRMKLLTDRYFYKPGETLHLFGTVRQIDAQGVWCLTEPVKATVRLYSDEEVSAEQTVQLNAHGAFSADITLPQDKAGDMYVKVLLPDGTGQSADIEVQELQRKSFVLRCQTEMKPVNPDSLTVMVEAVDYNGAPVTGTANISIEINGDVYHTMSATAEPDAEGKARCTFSLADLPVIAKGEERYVEVQVDVTNQRQEKEEYFAYRRIYSSDLSLCVKNDRLFCQRSGTQQAVSYPQTVQVQMFALCEAMEPLPNGILYLKDKKLLVKEWAVTVPADSQDGVPFVDEDAEEAVLKEHPELQGEDYEFLCVMTPAGSDDAEQFKWRLPSRKKKNGLTAQVQNKELHLALPEGVEGKLLIVLETQSGLRMVAAPAPAGKEPVVVPLLPQEFGQCLGVAVIQMQLTEQGVYEPKQWLTTSLVVPVVEEKLHVQLHLPQQPVLPGQLAELAGCVKTATGEPAANALVCLFAVDKGRIMAEAKSEFSFTLLDTWHLRGEFILAEDNFGHSAFYDSADKYRLAHMQAGPQKYLVHQLTPTQWVRWYDEGEHSYRGITLYNMGLGRLSLLQPHQLWPHCDDEIMYSSLSGEGGGYGMFRSSAHALGDGLGGVDSEWEIQGDVFAPRVRRDFTATPIWLPAVYTDAQGRFCVQAAVADTLTTYEVRAVALSADGRGCGSAVGEFLVNQPVMLTAGVPFFMSVGDSLRLPLTITNNTASPATWTISLQGDSAPQSVALGPRESHTLYFDVAAVAEGEQTLLWRAVNENSGDALEERVAVRFPAPELREIRYLRLQAGDAPLNPATLFTGNMQGAELVIEASTHPLSGMSGLVDFALKYPYGCTEQKSSVLIPWLLHAELAPLCPAFALVDATAVRKQVQRCVDELLERQFENGGLGYWSTDGEPCLWASAHAAMVLSIARERGFEVPQEDWADLCAYLRRNSQSDCFEKIPPFTQYAIGRALRDDAVMRDALDRALNMPKHEYGTFGWMHCPIALDSMRLLHVLRGENPHAAVMSWLQMLKEHGKYLSSWDAGWAFVALHEYLQGHRQQDHTATVLLADGRTLQPGQRSMQLPAGVVQCVQGGVYLTVRARAVPKQLPVPAVADHGIILQRKYEKQMPDGSWVSATDFKTGDEVRVTVQCILLHRGAQYLVIEDYLPSCFKPYTRADGSWSSADFLGDRMRVYCDSPGKDVLTLQYHARAVYSGTATAPPASAQLMYEPQVYGLSDSQKIQVSP